jgi:hypothetical protein
MFLLYLDNWTIHLKNPKITVYNFSKMLYTTQFLTDLTKYRHKEIVSKLYLLTK